jgi:aldehyde dehydrogenase (NAD+)
VRATEFVARIEAMTGCGRRRAKQEVEASISRLFTYAAWADKYDGAVHSVPIRGVSIAMNEPIGVIALVCDDAFPLLGLVSLLGPALATGNTTIAVPSQSHPLAATDFYSVLETSDVPAGVVNIVTATRTLSPRCSPNMMTSSRFGISGEREGVKQVELASASNMKRTWATWHERDWLDRAAGEGREFLRAATQVKNVWVRTASNVLVASCQPERSRTYYPELMTVGPSPLCSSG